MAPTLEDVTALADDTARRLVQRGKVRSAEDLLQAPPGLLRRGWRPVQAALGGSPETVYTTLLGEVQTEYRRLWRLHLEKVDGELLERAAPLFTRIILEDLLENARIINEEVAGRWPAPNKTADAPLPARHERFTVLETIEVGGFSIELCRRGDGAFGLGEIRKGKLPLRRADFLVTWQVDGKFPTFDRRDGAAVRLRDPPATLTFTPERREVAGITLAGLYLQFRAERGPIVETASWELGGTTRGLSYFDGDRGWHAPPQWLAADAVPQTNPKLVPSLLSGTAQECAAVTAREGFTGASIDVIWDSADFHGGAKNMNVWDYTVCEGYGGPKGLQAPIAECKRHKLRVIAWVPAGHLTAASPVWKKHPEWVLKNARGDTFVNPAGGIWHGALDSSFRDYTEVTRVFPVGRFCKPSGRITNPSYKKQPKAGSILP